MSIIQASRGGALREDRQEGELLFLNLVVAEFACG